MSVAQREEGYARIVHTVSALSCDKAACLFLTSCVSKQSSTFAMNMLTDLILTFAMNMLTDWILTLTQLGFKQGLVNNGRC